jgi:hypothetical protein
MAELNAPYRFVSTSCGEAILVHHMAAVDEHADLLASRLPIFLEDEAPLLAALTPAQKVLAFAKRMTALDKERALRALDATRTATYGGDRLVGA